MESSGQRPCPRGKEGITEKEGVKESRWHQLDSWIQFDANPYLYCSVIRKQYISFSFLILAWFKCILLVKQKQTYWQWKVRKRDEIGLDRMGGLWGTPAGKFALLRWVGSPKLSVRDAVTQLQFDSSVDVLRGSARTLPFNCEKWKWKSLSLIQLLPTPWTVAFQAPLSMEFFRQRILERVALLFCRGSSQPRNLLHCRQILYRLSHEGRNNISLQTINVIRLDKRGY